MELQTYTDIITKSKLDMDLVGENFCDDTELLGYMNEALGNAEKAIHTLGAEDSYFLVSDTMTLVSGTNDYDPPSDIYANKFRKIFYSNGTRKYEIVKVRRLADVQWFQSGDDYQFLIVNNSLENGGVKFRIYPDVSENGAFVTRWYIRAVRKFTGDTTDLNDKCELPECANFIYQHLRWNFAKKLRRPELIAIEKGDLEQQYQAMVEALKEMVPDENTKILADTSSYFEQEIGAQNI